MNTTTSLLNVNFRQISTFLEDFVAVFMGF